MKKMISILLLLAIICSLSTPALAGGTVQAANAPLSWAEVEPVKVFGHSEGITLTAAQTELVLANTDGELLHLPIPDGTTPSVSICTIADSFALLLHLEEPYLILFEDMTPDQLTLSGTFDRVTADSSLTTALTLIADEQSTISHMELFSPVTVENAGVIEKLSVVETATISGGDLPQNSLSAENTGNALEAAAQIICEEIARAIELHSESTEQSHVFLIVSGADTAVKAEAAEQPATLPVEKEDAPSVALPCGHMSDADGNHDKLSCGHYACASGDHAAAFCGASGHYNCDGKTHTAAVCETEGHTNCDEADHSKLPCGHFTCEDGDHTAAICGTAGHYKCAGNHAAAICGTSGHFNCDGDHNAAGCNTTGHFNCAGDHAAASCGAVGHYNCDGKTHQTPDCDTEDHCVSDGKNHGYTSCEHLSGGQLMHHFCDGADHTWCDVCSRLKCDYSGDLADHTTAMPCGHMKCQQGNGKDHTAADCGTTGHYNCAGDHAAALCGTTGHFNCGSAAHDMPECNVRGHCESDGMEHGICSVCSQRLCNGSDHAAGDCGTPGHTNCDGGNHGMGACNEHYNCEPDDHHLLDCGHHYACEEGAHGQLPCGNYRCYEGHYFAACRKHCTCQPGDHDNKYACGHYKCADGDHADADCGTTGHYNCDGDTHRTPDCGKEGHCVSDSKTHTTASCGTAGHTHCDNADHGQADCETEGHYKCDGKHHEHAACATWYNDQGLPDLANHRQCGGGEHGLCNACEKPLCYGDHSAAPCGVAGHYVCDEYEHLSPSEASKRGFCGEVGHCAYDGGDHGKVVCIDPDGRRYEHFRCDGRTHGGRPCANCNQLYCVSECSEGDHTTPMPCGHMKCAEGNGDPHTNRLPCGHYECKPIPGGHGDAPCGTTDHYVCDGKTHTDADCGTTGHCVSDEMNHGDCPNCTGHLCDDGNHSGAVCGIANHTNCDGKTHTTESAPCGQHKACAEGDHSTVLPCGKYACEEGHSLAACGQHCTCNTEHTDHSAADCGTEGHYNCDGKNHTDYKPCGNHRTCAEGSHYRAACNEHFKCAPNFRPEDHQCPGCGNPPCQGYSRHRELDCGHYSCTPGIHDLGACGKDDHYVCGNPYHYLLRCGNHYACEGGDHDRLNCGHYACAGGDHSTKHTCGTHYLCGDSDTSAHAELPCGHYACAGGDHGPSTCGVDGHYNCDGWIEHSQGLDCGHYACQEGDHAAFLTCQHYACEEGHGKANCGQHCIVCDSGDHSEAECGIEDHYKCTGDHTACTVCGELLCNGEDHSDADCNVDGHTACDGDDHPPGACGKPDHYNCTGDHDQAACGTSGHYKCDEDPHRSAAGGDYCGQTGHFTCDGKYHTKAQCGQHWECLLSNEEFTAHNIPADCGHYACDGEDHTSNAPCGKHPACAEGDHTAASCGLNGHFKCDGLTTHNLICGICRQRVCNGIDHSDLNCGHRSCEDGHAPAPCGQHCTCQTDKVHTAASCGTPGHYNCDGKTHTTAPCGTSGHLNCDGDHTKLSCEHYACEEGHSLAACGTHCICNDIPSGHEKCSINSCQRYKCDPHSHIAYFCGHVEGDPGTHEKCPCGGWLCDGKDHNHLSGGGGIPITYPCGHTTGYPFDHVLCDLCNAYKCNGSAHGNCPNCAGYLCDGNDHSGQHPPCGINGHTTDDGYYHDACPACDGYVCDGNDHSHGSFGPLN